MSGRIIETAGVWLKKLVAYVIFSF